MNWLMNNWYMIIIVIAVLISVITTVINFTRLNTTQQMESVKEWLVYACLKAEQMYGSKTGQIKLRFVYDLFITKFTWLGRVVSFEQISAMVDEALITMKGMLESNKAVSDIVNKEGE